MLFTKAFFILCSATLVTARLLQYDSIITVRAAYKAALEPSSEAPNEDSYSGFKIMVSSFPGFEFNFAKFSDFSFKGRFDLEEHASVIYQNFARSDRNEADEVASALMDIVGDHLKEEGEEEKQGLFKNQIFAAVVIRQLDFTIQLEIVELSVRSGQRGDYVATLEVRSFQVITPVLTARAKELAKDIPVVLVKDFIKYFATSSSKNSVRASFQTGQQIKAPSVHVGVENRSMSRSRRHHEPITYNQK
ncbi:hypothetical protein BGZ75_004428 [Mortierella antarctica]|nr:hypothetical protein BGZ75_004428 [Mortierella antarctica]